MISSTICHSFLRALFPSEVRDSHALLNYCECHEVIPPTRHVTFAEAETADISIFCTVVHQLLCTLFADILLIFSFSVFCRYEAQRNRYQFSGPTYCLIIGRYVAAAAVDSHLAERDRWSPTFPCICVRRRVGREFNIPFGCGEATMRKRKDHRIGYGTEGTKWPNSNC